MKRKTNRRPQTQKPRFLPTSGFGTHGDDLKDADKKAARGSWLNPELVDEVTNWKDYV